MMKIKRLEEHPGKMKTAITTIYFIGVGIFVFIFFYVLCTQILSSSPNPPQPTIDTSVIATKPMLASRGKLTGTITFNGVITDITAPYCVGITYDPVRKTGDVTVDFVFLQPSIYGSLMFDINDIAAGKTLDITGDPDTRLDIVDGQVNVIKSITAKLYAMDADTQSWIITAKVKLPGNAQKVVIRMSARNIVDGEHSTYVFQSGSWLW